MTEEAQRPPDAALLAAGARGDADAFAALYRRNLPLVLRWLLRQTGDRELSADLAAEVFAAALVSARRYEPERGPVVAWVLGIAHNKLRESRRRHRVEESARRRLGFEPIVLGDADLERVEELACGESQLQALLDGLPPDQREALRGRVLEERPYAELAARMSCSELVLRKRVSRALKTLRSQVEEP
jgi:RNA polymerase sigma factor (sigma-70 family)